MLTSIRYHKYSVVYTRNGKASNKNEPEMRKDENEPVKRSEKERKQRKQRTLKRTAICLRGKRGTPKSLRSLPCEAMAWCG
jgi:hypothetical protein